MKKMNNIILTKEEKSERYSDLIKRSKNSLASYILNLETNIRQLDQNYLDKVSFQDLTKPIKNFGGYKGSGWGNALAGETGEVCNLIKKLERDGLIRTINYLTGQKATEHTCHDMDVFRDYMGKELADVFVYTVLTAQHYSINLEEAIVSKLKIVNKRPEAQVTK